MTIAGGISKLRQQTIQAILSIGLINICPQFELTTLHHHECVVSVGPAPGLSSRQTTQVNAAHFTPLSIGSGSC